jgi:hypothetical protein
MLLEGDDEVAWRSAVNRAYYAAYHSLLEVCDFLPASSDEQLAKDRISHAEVIARIRQWKPIGSAACLRRMTVSANKALQEMRRSRSLRELADYRLTASINKTDARQQITRASQLCRFVVQVQAELKRSNDASTPVH